MDRNEPEPSGERFFKQLHMDEAARKKLADLARIGAASQSAKPTITFIAAQSDTLSSTAQEKENA